MRYLDIRSQCARNKAQDTGAAPSLIVLGAVKAALVLFGPQSYLDISGQLSTELEGRLVCGCRKAEAGAVWAEGGRMRKTKTKTMRVA